MQEEFQDTKGVISIRKSKKNRQHTSLLKLATKYTLKYCYFICSTRSLWRVGACRNVLDSYNWLSISARIRFTILLILSGKIWRKKALNQLEFVSDLRQVGGFLLVLRLTPRKTWPPWYYWYIVESGVKHHKPKPMIMNSTVSHYPNSK